MSDEADSSDMMAGGMLDADDDYARALGHGGSSSSAGHGGGAHGGPDRKRRAHNETEQRRAKRINDSIERVRTLLLASGINPPRDKAGVLADGVTHFAGMHARVDTLHARVDELTAYIRACGLPLPPSSGDRGVPTVPPSVRPRESVPPPPAAIPHSIRTSERDEVDFESVFMHSSLPQVVSSVDGRFLQCSDMFCKVTGYTREEVLTRSIFNLTPSEYLPHTFALVGEMVSEANTPRTTAETSGASTAVPADHAAGRKRARAASSKPSCVQSQGASVMSSSRAFNKVCKMKNGLALVHVRMNLIKDAASDEAKYLLCTILPMSATDHVAQPATTAPTQAAETAAPPARIPMMAHGVTGADYGMSLGGGGKGDAGDGSSMMEGMTPGDLDGMGGMDGLTSSGLDGLMQYPYSSDTHSPVDVLSLLCGGAAPYAKPPLAPPVPAAFTAWEVAAGADASSAGWAQPGSSAGMALSQAMLASANRCVPGIRLPTGLPPPAPGQGVTSTNSPFVVGAWDCTTAPRAGTVLLPPAPQQYPPLIQQQMGYAWSAGDGVVGMRRGGGNVPEMGAPVGGQMAFTPPEYAFRGAAGVGARD